MATNSAAISRFSSSISSRESMYCRVTSAMGRFVMSSFCSRMR